MVSHCHENDVSLIKILINSSGQHSGFGWSVRGFSNYYSAVRQIAEYEKRRPKKYRNSGWRYYDSFYRGGRYGRPLPETGYVYYDTQAWAVLRKCWKGFKIAKSQRDFDTMKYYAAGIRKAQKELGLKVESFPNLGLRDTHEDGDGHFRQDEVSYEYESPAQRSWRERIEKYC